MVMINKIECWIKIPVEFSLNWLSAIKMGSKMILDAGKRLAPVMILVIVLLINPLITMRVKFWESNHNHNHVCAIKNAHENSWHQRVSWYRNFLRVKKILLSQSVSQSRNQLIPDRYSINILDHSRLKRQPWEVFYLRRLTWEFELNIESI